MTCLHVQVRATAVTALKAVAEVGHTQALQGCLDRMQSKQSFVRAAALEAFCAICPSSDARLVEVTHHHLRALNSPAVTMY